jgi:cytoskeletal protein RodZ
MSSTPFGEHLRREREMRGVSLEEIAAATRISTRFLEALESEHWDRLPGGAFNRGFIRSVARFLGIDEDALVAEYSFERQDSNGARVAVPPAGKLPRNWRAIIVTLLALVMLTAAIGFVYHHYGAWIRAHSHFRSTGPSMKVQVNKSAAETSH